MSNVLNKIQKAFSATPTPLKWLGVALLCFLIFFWFLLPKQLFTQPLSAVIEDADGNLLNASIAADGQWRFPQTKNVPQKFIDCITTFEDKRFFIHPGVDPIALSRAVISNIKNKKTVQGGSTLSMQVIRLSQKNSKRSLWNKAKESLLAIRLELSYSKKEIIQLYASYAPFGGNVVSLDAAAWRYFGRSAEKLSWAEMATLAVLPNAPSLIHPGRNRNALLDKRNRLLDQLVSAGKISAQTATLAKTEILPEKPVPLPQQAPHLLQFFRSQQKKLSLPARLTSTLQGNLQRSVTQIVQQHHQSLKGNGINNICALVLDVETGNALAYVGNIYQPSNPEMESDVDIIQSARSPGSALKPILYAAMLSDGLLLPEALIADVPTDISGYTPKNFDLAFDGAVPAGRALSRSLNIPAVKLLQQYKYPRFYDLLQQSGISTLKNPADFYGLSLILGGCEVSMWELAGLYASFARILNHQQPQQGKLQLQDVHPPNYYTAASKTSKAPSHFNIDPTSIYFTFQAMQEVMRPGEEGLWQQFSSSQKIAWKTGTSFGFRDGWAIGVTAKNVVAVWAGNADGEGRPGLIGVQTAAPVMFDIFRLLPSVTWFPSPKYNFTYVPVCKKSGYRANIDCDITDTLLMPPMALKSISCPYHKLLHLDSTGRYQVNENCASPASMIHKSWFILPPAMEYYYKQRNHDYALPPPFKEGCFTQSSISPMEIIYPHPNGKIYVPIEINGERGKTIFIATHRQPGKKIFWSLNDQFLATTQSQHQVAVSPPAGQYTLSLTDENGQTIQRQFEIIDKEK